MNFDRFIEDIKNNGWNIHGVAVHENGELTYSYGDTANRYPIYSATKTITSLAAGMAIDDGKIKLTDCILDYMPTWAVKGLSSQQLNNWKYITIERLLTMSVAGFPFRPEGKNWLSDSLNTALNMPEHKTFEYSNVSAYLVGVAVAEAIGGDVYEYLCDRLFTPLGIAEPPYMRCPDGYWYGASKMELSVNELSRIGLLLANGGSYGGKRIVSADYIARAVSCQMARDNGGYGYFIWINECGYSINGKWEQKCYVLPQRKRIITYLGDVKEGCEGLKYSLFSNLLA